jgi:AraC-like DNA-binding protein
VLLAIHDGGVIACRDGKIVHQYRASNCGFIPHDLVYWVHEDRKGNWWLGTYKGLSVRYQDGREYCFNQLPDADKLLSKEITSIMEDNNGSLWLATNNNGIVHVTGNMEQPGSLQCKNYCIENGLLPVNTPLCFLLDKSGKVWVGTEGSGLCLYDAQNDCFRSVHQEYNLPGDMVGSMEEDNNGNLWLGTNQGLVKLTITGEEKGRVRIFTVADGLADNFFNQNASFYRNGTFYFGCSRGIVTFNSKMAEGNHSDVSLCITDIWIDGKSLEQMPENKRREISPFTADFTEQLVVPAAYSNFTICFASLTYNHPQQNNYAYRLQGLDTDWHYVNASNRNAYYSKLSPGEYVFELRATNENGDWGEIRKMEITIRPPFWATWWAYLVYAFISVSVLALIWWEVRRRLLLRNRKYLQKGETDKVHHIKFQFFTNIASDDEKFLQDAIACVNRHLSDTDFDVPQFIDEMATSRTTLHKKLKSLTGLNTTGFVRSIRLKAACNIMDGNKNIRISDLAYQVGFNDPKYFSICFKKEFGMQPTEYAMKAAKNA